MRKAISRLGSVKTNLNRHLSIQLIVKNKKKDGKIEKLKKCEKLKDM